MLRVHRQQHSLMTVESMLQRNRQNVTFQGVMSNIELVFVDLTFTTEMFSRRVYEQLECNVSPRWAKLFRQRLRHGMCSYVGVNGLIKTSKEWKNQMKFSGHEVSNLKLPHCVMQYNYYTTVICTIDLRLSGFKMQVITFISKATRNHSINQAFSHFVSYWTRDSLCVHLGSHS